MATVKKGILTATKEWAAHLRAFGKRDFWKRERKASIRDSMWRTEEVESIRAIDAEIDWMTESRQIKFDRSSGCVFCDLGLEPEGGYHMVSRHHDIGGWVRDGRVACQRAG